MGPTGCQPLTGIPAAWTAVTRSSGRIGFDGSWVFACHCQDSALAIHSHEKDGFSSRISHHDTEVEAKTFAKQALRKLKEVPDSGELVACYVDPFGTGRCRYLC